MLELVLNSTGTFQFVPQNGKTCHDKIVAKSRASVSLALLNDSELSVWTALDRCSYDVIVYIAASLQPQSVHHLRYIEEYLMT